MLELLKVLLSITDDSKDGILNHYLQKSRRTIQGYLGVTEIDPIYDDTVVDYAVVLYQNRNTEGLKAQTQGSRSQTYVESIPEIIKMALPKPKVKVGT